jgi:hypothetical protein
LSSWLLTAIVFICLSAGASLGMCLRVRLPARHLDDPTKDVVRVAMGLLATMAALVLGLLVASAKSSYDARISEFNQVSANLVLLDATLAQYGPESKEARDLLRRAATLVLERAWPENAAQSSSVAAADTTVHSRAMYTKIQELAPQTDMQRRLQVQALQISATLGTMRWLLAAQQEGSTIPMPFMLVLVFWLSVLFTSFGLFAPRNATVVATIALCALSISGAILLILELARPFEGILQISSAPLRAAIAQLGQ